MPSNLFTQALGSLTEEEREAFGRWEELVRDHSGFPPDQPTKGARILENFREEAHLVGDGSFGDPSEMTAFLRRCISGLDLSAEPAARHKSYEDTCQEFAGRGLRVSREHLPEGLLRYSESQTLAATLVQRMLGKRARDAFDLKTLPPEMAFARLRSRWRVSHLDPKDRLGRGKEVFATFEHPSGAPREDAEALSRALALPLWQRRREDLTILIELTYPTDAVEDHRFPTVADSGWIQYFRPAPEEVPNGERPDSCCGWTEPLGSYPKQPEIIHDNAPLQVLSEPPRLVGTIP